MISNKFEKYYDNIRQELHKQKRDERVKEENSREPYIPPKFTKIGSNCLQNEK